MIDVPARVRDALRDGRRRKNYRFTVYEKQTNLSYEYVDYLTEDTEHTIILNGEYRFYEPDYNTGFTFDLTRDGTTQTIVVPADETSQVTSYFIELYQNDVIKVYSINDPFILQRVTRSTSYTEDFEIDNDTLVSESVKFDERMCSGDVLKFGLCEGTSLEFQYFDHPSIRGRRIYAEIDVEYEDADPDWVTEKRFTDWENQWTCEYSADYEVYVDTGEVSIMVNVSRNGRGIKSISTYLLQAGSVYLGNLKKGDLITISHLSGCSPSFVYIKRKELTKWYTIPMGYFEVDKCPMQFSTGIRKVTAYNKLKSEYLDEKANTIIEDMLSDTGDMDTVTIQTIMDNLLEDYAIQIPRPEVPLILNNGGTASVYYNDWTFKFVGESTSRKVQIGHDTSASYSDGSLGPHFMGKRLYFEMDKYIEALETNIWDFKTYVYRYIQDPDAFWARFKAEAVQEAGIMVHRTNTGPGFEFYLAKDAVPESGIRAGGYPVRPIQKLRYLQDIGNFTFHFLNLFGYRTNGVTTWTYQYAQDFTAYNRPRVYESEKNSVGSISVDKTKLADVTLRDIVSANYELNCQYGKLDRETDLFSGVELNHSWLYPRDTLYPADNLYPGGGGLVAERGNKSAYSKLWTDSAGQQSFRNLIIKYKGLDEDDKEKEYTLTRTINANGTIDYNMTDNWLFKNLVWTEADVGTYADAMIAKLQNVSWIPFEMWAAGLPYLETGDEIEITNSEGTHKSYVLQRVLSGIQNLQDTYINGTLEIF